MIEGECGERGERVRGNAGRGVGGVRMNAGGREGSEDECEGKGEEWADVRREKSREGECKGRGEQ